MGEDRLVHYKRTSDHEFSDRVEGEEATRKGLIVWDCLALKGGCHIFINGEGDDTNEGAITFAMWEKDTAPETTEGIVYYLINDCVAINKSAKAGTMWQYKDTKWVEYTGEIYG